LRKRSSRGREKKKLIYAKIRIFMKGFENRKENGRFSRKEGRYSEKGVLANKSKLAPEFNFILIHCVLFD